MAVNLVVLYRRPLDPDAFLDHYARVHAPLVETFPGLMAFQHGPIRAALAGSDEWFYLAWLTFADRTQLDAALASEAGRAAGRDVRAFAADLFDMVVQEVVPS